MNTMTGIAREAMRRAQAGDWALADAIELLSRKENSHSELATLGVELLCGIPEGGRLRYLVWVHAFIGLECGGCHNWEGGEGDAVATDEPCDECNNERITNNPFDRDAFWDQLAVVTNLNGDVIWDCERKCEDADLDAVCNLVAHDTHQMPAAAMRLVAEYQESLGKVEQPHIQIPEAA